jgi:predicted nucleotidyltransferase
MTTPPIQTVFVPPINKRTRIPQEAIDDVVRQIVEKFKPNKIILFGSYAYGIPTQVSDVDLLVVMDSSIKENRLSIAIRRAINYHFGLDLIVVTPKSISSRIEMGDFFSQRNFAEGEGSL